MGRVAKNERQCGGERIGFARTGRTGFTAVDEVGCGRVGMVGKCAACRGGYLLSSPLAPGARIRLVKPAKIFLAVFAYNNDEIAELTADGVIGRAALSLFRRKLSLLLLQQVPVKLVIFTHRNQQCAAIYKKPQNNIKMGIHHPFRHQLP
jgi:hypothetical protein